MITIDFLRHGQPHGGDILRGRVDPELTDLVWSQMQKATGLSANHTHSALKP